MEIRKSVDVKTGNEYTFVCDSFDTRDGFGHKVTLFCNNREISSAKRFYLNRTWECYRYQSAMHDAVNNVLKELKENIKNEFKNSHNYSTMNAKRTEEFNKYLETCDRSEKIKEYERLSNVVKNTYFPS